MLDAFRRHQKVIFVILTVLCMGAFSFDVLLTRLAPGPRDPAKDVLGRIDGEPVTRDQLRYAHQLRLTSARFMQMLRGQWAESIAADEQTTWDFLILLRRARAAGVAISDEAITQYIRVLTGPKFGVREFGQLLSRMQLGERMLYQGLKAYLATQLYAQMWQERLPLLSPGRQGQSLLTPLEAWDAFRRTEAQVRVALTAVDPASFASGVTPPTEAEIQAQYDRYKDRLPGPDPNDYGYKQPARIRVEYVTADLKDYLDDPAIRADADVLQRYYDTHKWEFLKTPEETAAERAAATQATTRPSTTQASSTQASSTQATASRAAATTQAATSQAAATQAATTQAATTQAAQTQPDPFKPFDQVRDVIRARVRREQAIEQISQHLRRVETRFQSRRRDMSAWDEPRDRSIARG